MAPRPLTTLASISAFASLALAALSGCGSRTTLAVDGREAGDGGGGAGGSGAGGDGALRCLDAAPATFTTTGEVSFASLAPGPSCDLFAVGNHFGDTDFAGLSTSAEDWNGIVVHVGRDGVADWMIPIASAGDSSWADGADEVVVDGAGRAWVHGYAGSPLELGGQTLIGDFILALDASGGVRWVKQLESYSYDLARRSDGAIVAIEKEAGLVEVVLDGESGALVSRLPLFEGQDVQLLDAVTRPSGRAFAVCFRGTVQIGSLTLTASDDTLDGNGQVTCDLALVSFDPSGALRYAKTFEEHGFYPYSGRLDLDDSGALAAALSFWGTVDLGLGPLAASPIGSGMRGLVASFTTSGTVRTSEAFGAGDLVLGTGIVAAPAGGFALSGLLYGAELGLGEGDIGSGPGAYLGFDARFAADGGLLSAHARPELDALAAAEPGLALALSRTPDGETPRVITVAREAIAAD